MPNSSIETIYYQDGAIRITNTHATFPTHTYALTDIVSASTRILPSQLAPGVGVILTGIIVLVVGLYWHPLLLGPFGLLIAALGFEVMRRAHTSYAVRLWSRSGEVDVLVTQDQAYTQTIVGALTTAINQQILTRLDSSDHRMPGLDLQALSRQRKKKRPQPEHLRRAQEAHRGARVQEGE